MQSGVGRMSALIDNVLDFARGRLGGGLDLTLAEQPLTPVLQQIVAELQATARDRKIEAVFALSRPDRMRPRQVRPALLQPAGQCADAQPAGQPGTRARRNPGRLLRIVGRQLGRAYSSRDA
jgi:sigma-B regulation protein RsbU (phosphoserine phosphatase)